MLWLVFRTEWRRSRSPTTKSQAQTEYSIRETRKNSQSWAKSRSAIRRQSQLLYYSDLRCWRVTFSIGRSPVLNIDCEGSDLAVIRGLELDRCHPAILSIEAFGDAEGEAIEQTVAPHGYRCEVRIPPTMIFVRR
jgi:hypothetical protein